MGYKIQKSTGSYGKYVIHISKIESKYFWLKKDAIIYLDALNKFGGVVEINALNP